MGRIKYYYNTETCSYEKINQSGKGIFLKLLVLIVMSSVMAYLIIFVFNLYFESPHEAQLRQENKKLHTYYEILQQEVANSAKILADLERQDSEVYRLVLNQKPISPVVRNAGVGGIKRYEHLKDDPLIATVLEKVDQLKRKLTIQKQSYSYIAKLARNNSKRLASMPAVRPIFHAKYKRISSPFCTRRLHPVLRTYRPHNGIDFAAPRGTAIHAPGGGTVKHVRKHSPSAGNWILIDHGYGIHTRYLHMDVIKVVKNQRVKRGQILGTVGSTGFATAPHLHYEVHKHSKPVNPIHYFGEELTASEYSQIVQQAATMNNPSICSH